MKPVRSTPAAPPSYEVVETPVGDLKADPANPRHISRDQLEALTESIRRFGFVQPVLVRRSDGVVIGGHQRLTAALRLGYTAVPAIFLDITKDEAHTLNIALNRISGDWDNELLGRLLADLSSVAELDLQLTGFSQQEIDALIGGLDSREKRTREESFDLEGALDFAAGPTRVQRGELWALGPHRLFCGDACSSSDVALLTAGRSAEMCFTDPPYNVSLGDHGGRPRGQRRRRIENDALTREQWEAFVRSWAANLLSMVDGAIYVCMSSKEWPLVSHVLADSGAHWSDTIIWAKDRFVIGRADYQRQYEPIWYGWREGQQHHWCGQRDQSDVWHISRPSVSDAHPTMKPLELVERAIENSSRAGDAVADLFLGSGTTLIAAERTSRICYGMEIDPRYASVALARWEAFTGQRAERQG